MARQSDRDRRRGRHQTNGVGRSGFEADVGGNQKIVTPIATPDASNETAVSGTTPLHEPGLEAPCQRPALLHTFSTSMAVPRCRRESKDCLAIMDPANSFAAVHRRPDLSCAFYLHCNPVVRVDLVFQCDPMHFALEDREFVPDDRLSLHSRRDTHGHTVSR